MLHAHFSALRHKLLCSEAPLVPFRVTHEQRSRCPINTTRVGACSLQTGGAPIY